MAVNNRKNGNGTVNLVEKTVENLYCLPLVELKELTVKKMAKKMGVSSSHLCREFRNNKQATIQQCIREQKLIRATFILKDHAHIPANKVHEIVGFYSNNHFNLVFSKYFHITPSRFKKCSQNSNILPLIE